MHQGTRIYAEDAPSNQGATTTTKCSINIIKIPTCQVPPAITAIMKNCNTIKCINQYE